MPAMMLAVLGAMPRLRNGSKWLTSRMALSEASTQPSPPRPLELRIPPIGKRKPSSSGRKSSRNSSRNSSATRRGAAADATWERNAARTQVSPDSLTLALALCCRLRVAAFVVGLLWLGLPAEFCCLALGVKASELESEAVKGSQWQRWRMSTVTGNHINRFRRHLIRVAQFRC